MKLLKKVRNLRYRFIKWEFKIQRKISYLVGKTIPWIALIRIIFLSIILILAVIIKLTGVLD